MGGHIVGVVLGLGKSDANTTNNSTVDANSYSVSAYGVIRQSDKELAQAMMGYGHIKVDNKKVSIPSFQTKPGQTISLSVRGSKLKFVLDSLEKKITPAKWLSRKAIVGKIDRLPLREELDDSIRENLIIEFYSR